MYFIFQQVCLCICMWHAQIACHVCELNLQYFLQTGFEDFLIRNILHT